MISNKKKTRRQKSKQAWEDHRRKLLDRVGYTKLKAKHGQSAPADMPDYSVDSRYKLSNTIGNGLRVKTGGQHADAKQFPIYEAHKSNPVLMIPSDGKEFSGGKKPN